MSRFAIETHSLGKQFKIGVHSGSNALHQTLEAAVRRLIPGLRPEEQERGVLWALRHDGTWRWPRHVLPAAVALGATVALWFEAISRSTANACTTLASLAVAANMGKKTTCNK